MSPGDFGKRPFLIQQVWPGIYDSTNVKSPWGCCCSSGGHVSHSETRLSTTVRYISHQSGRSSLKSLQITNAGDTMENSMKVPQKTKSGITICSSIGSVQFSSVAQSCLTLCNLMDCIHPDKTVIQKHPYVHSSTVHSSQRMETI